MRNPYRQIKEIAERHGMDVEEIIHALMASSFLNCCADCSEKLQSEAFQQTFSRLAEEFEFCRDFFRPAA